jgi:hypothetical protein
VENCVARSAGSARRGTKIVGHDEVLVFLHEFVGSVDRPRVCPPVAGVYHYDPAREGLWRLLRPRTTLDGEEDHGRGEKHSRKHREGEAEQGS